MKTATIVSYHVFGTKSTKCCDVCYRGKRVFTIAEENYESALVKKAVERAKDNGFTHYKIIYN